MDQFNVRQSVEHNLDAYGGILPRNLSYSSIHNFHVTGRLLQPVDLNGSNTHNVYSIIRTSELNNRTITYHGTSDHYNLYTDLNRPVVGPLIDGIYEPGSNMHFSDETYWGI